MNSIKISVIVPTYNRQDLLKDQISALMSQSMPQQHYEVIVVNDGSEDGTRTYLDQLTSFYGNLKVFHHQNGGPAKARNTALKAASGEIVAFTDDDCVVENNWLRTILSFWKSSTVGMQGLTYADRERVTPLTHQIDNATGHNSVPTCNAAYLRSALISIGGFDETFPSPHNEDADVSWQMQQIGEVMFCPEMRVYHPPRTDSFRKVSRRMDIMVSEFTLYRKSPALYKKYRDKGPLRHIYGKVFFHHLGYHFMTRIKWWKHPKLMMQGMGLSLIWWLDLLLKFPRFLKMSWQIKVSP